MNFKIKNLGECLFDSPLTTKFPKWNDAFVNDNEYTPFQMINENDGNDNNSYGFELAGPRKKIYFNPKTVKVAIATCGGLCPGLNNVIRAIVMESYHRYGIRNIVGIKYGYNGLNPEKGYEMVELNPDVVDDIHKKGGTILGSSRGGTEDMDLLVERLHELKIDILYTIGGDGTLRGARDVVDIAEKKGYKIAVIGIPKTIDNDINFIQKSFGFDTAVSQAIESIDCAHYEAKGAYNGIGLVKLMGRDSGFIAANATLAMSDVNFVLVPEIEFELYGENGFLKHLEHRLQSKQHAVICVAEGAGQNLIANENKRKDASGNVILDDIGIFLKEKIKAYFKERKMEMSLKYIDPSYIIRSTPANSNDAVFCLMLGQFAVHAGMAGKTNLVIGLWNNIYTHVPIDIAVIERKKINPNSRFWASVISSTGQPENMKN